MTAPAKPSYADVLEALGLATMTLNDAMECYITEGENDPETVAEMEAEISVYQRVLDAAGWNRNS